MNEEGAEADANCSYRTEDLFGGEVTLHSGAR
jgi:hypothetical protein